MKNFYKQLCLAAALMSSTLVALPSAAQEVAVSAVPDPSSVRTPALAAPIVANGACVDGYAGPVLKLQITDLKDEKGQFRIELYGDDPEMFLEGKGQIYKVFAPLPETEDDYICVTAPSAGQYGLLVIHDRDNDFEPDFLSDGFGLSTNPKLKLRRPRLEEAIFTISETETLLEITMQYVTGGKKKKRSGPRGK